MEQCITEAKQQSKMLTKFNLHVAASLCVLLLLLFETFFPQPKRLVSITNPVFTILTPISIKKIEVNYTDDAKTLFDLKNFSFTINSECVGKQLLLIVVQSGTKNFVRRDIIRQTWGKLADATKIVFLLAQTKDKKITERIKNESILFGDIVQGTVNDGYRNLTYKHVMGLKWVVSHCNTSKYILKADDDVILNADSLKNFLVRVLSPWGAENLILCKRHLNMPVIRNKSKWRVTTNEYKENKYPPYCAGFSILYSYNVIPALLSHLSEVPYFFIDDVYITGFLRLAANLNLTDMSDIYEPGHKLNYGGFKKSAVFGGFNFDSAKMQYMWRKLGGV